LVAHTYNPSTQEVEAGGSWVWGQPMLHNKTLSRSPWLMPVILATWKLR
jgi:hypothetical protein